MRLVVKSHHPWKNRLLALLVSLALLMAAWSLFEYGRYSAGFDSREAAELRSVWVETRDSLEATIDQLRAEKAILERASQIERGAYSELDETLRQLQAEILELKGELAFYRGIVSPRDAARGLHLQNVELEPNGQPEGYRYKIILTQVLKNDRVVYGRVNVAVEGTVDGVPVSLNLSRLTENSVKELNYRFKYFQSLEGDIRLPAEFQPRRVRVEVLPGGRQEDEIVKTINWPV
ncbi:MAG: DUF6776 family protein [Gammaproteobacteria bacterium]